jgi:hypothetical protein
MFSQMIVLRLIGWIFAYYWAGSTTGTSKDSSKVNELRSLKDRLARTIDIGVTRPASSRAAAAVDKKDSGNVYSVNNVSKLTGDWIVPFHANLLSFFAAEYIPFPTEPMSDPGIKNAAFSPLQYHNAIVDGLSIDQICIAIVHFSPALHSTPAHYISEYQKTASQSLSFLSASNWDVFQASINANLAQNGIGVNQMFYADSTNTEQDFTPCRVIEYCFLNRSRLFYVFETLGSTIRVLQKKSLAIQVPAFKQSVWNWIKACPTEYAKLLSTNHGLHGSPEIDKAREMDVLFELMLNSADSVKTKKLYWPLLTAMYIAEEPNIKRSSVKRAGTNLKPEFIDQLKKALKGKFVETALVSMIQLVGATNYVSKNDAPSLYQLVSSLEVDIHEKLFDPKNPWPRSSEDMEINISMMADCASSLYRFNPLFTLRTLIPTLLSKAAPPHYKAVFTEFCRNLIVQETKPWHAQFDPQLGENLRNILLVISHNLGASC